MKKFGLFFFVLFLINTTVFTQNISSQLAIEENIQKIEEALLKKDTISLKLLLHPNLTMGHSNGWIETKASLIEDLTEEKVVYTLFQPINKTEYFYTSEDLIMTRRDIDAHGTVNHKEFVACLNVLEIWTFYNNQWLLTARQSVNRKE